MCKLGTSQEQLKIEVELLIGMLIGRVIYVVSIGTTDDLE